MRSISRASRNLTVGFILLATGLLQPVLAVDDPIRIGLNVDSSRVSAAVGTAIKRGALLAIEEINEAGGVLGRPTELVERDHRRNPARGVVNVEELAADPTVVAILGGKYTPIIIGELETIHRLQIPYLIPWAAGTPLIDHAFNPSYTFRVSVRDEWAGPFLVEHARTRGFSRLALLLEQTGWGRSNERAMVQAIVDRDLEVVRVEWFNWNQPHEAFTPALERLSEAGADAFLFVGNAPEAIQLVQALLNQAPESRLPMISHWGLVGDELEEQMGAYMSEIDHAILQTFSFHSPPIPERAEPVLRRYLERFHPAGNLSDIPVAPAVAHAYDLVHLLARAIESAGSTDRRAIRDALERLDFHPGLMRDYAPPFTSERHEALDATDYTMARFVDGVWTPLVSTP
jgi:branched-chain amino acid transport system substrate-binding protein